MRSRSGSSFPTLMLTLPLIAIPLMAVFGVPQFVPVIASSVSEEEYEHNRQEIPRSSGVGESVVPTSFVTAGSMRPRDSSSEDHLHDLFSLTKSKPAESRPIHSRQLGPAASFYDRSVLAAISSEVAMTDLQRDKLADLFGPEADTPDYVDLRTTEHWSDASVSIQTQRTTNTTRTNSTDGLTWRRAVQRLNELGIHQFRLEPGRDPGEFYFSCEFSIEQDSRITRRFEAEAPEPLQAVELVLRQIDEWTRRR